MMGYKELSQKIMKILKEFNPLVEQISINEAIDSTNLIYEMGVKLLENFDYSVKFRLIGVGIWNFSSGGGVAKQLNLYKKLDVKGEFWEGMESAIDVIKEKFGSDAIKRGEPRLS